jgi:tripartite-type tricarboxylate transporter receptor subunit TctC
MTWFAFQDDGHVYDLNGTAEKELSATFAHGYATEAEALAHKNNSASALQAQLLAEFLTAASSPAGGGTLGVIQVVNTDASGQNTSTVSPTNNPVTSALSGLLPSFTNLRDFVVRAVKVVAGLALVIVGVSRMAGADKQVIGTAKKVLA